MKTRLLSLTLCMVLLLLTACGGTNAPSDSSGPTPVTTMGRYVERQLPTPEGLGGGMVAGVKQFEDGSVWIVGTGAEKCMVFSSTDFGESWQKESYPWVDELPGYVMSAHIVSPDEIYLSVMNIKAINADNTADSDDYFYKASRTELTELDTTPLTAYSNQYGIRFIQLTEAGDLLVRNFDGIAHMDGLTGRAKNLFACDKFALYGSWTSHGDRLMVAEVGKIHTYSLTDGSLLHTADSGTPLTSTLGVGYNTCEISAITVDPADDSAVFYANKHGLFRTFLDGSATEHIMDADLSSLNLHTNYVRYLFADGEENFLAITNNSNVNTFYRYEFNPDIPSTPSREIKVFSLYDNRTARQAVTQMQAGDPDLKISMQIAMPDGSGITAADALRTLSTEMLSGGGPDVLILDGLPVETYIESGVLRDLAPLFAEAFASGDYMPQAQTYKSEDGKLYAVTARFEPMHMVVKSGAEITDMQSLIAYLDTQPVYSVGCHPVRMMEKFYPYLSPSWFPGDDTFDAAQFQSDLECFAKIIANQKDFHPDAERLTYEGTNAGNATVGVAYNTFPVAFFRSYNWMRTSNAQHFINAGIIDGLLPFPGTGVYKATNTYGINAASKQTDLAEEFVRYVMGPEIQPILLNDGFGVHIPSLIASAKTQFPPDMADAPWGMSVYDAVADEFVTPDFRWAWVTEDEAKGHIADWSTWTAHTYDDAVVLEMVIAETDAFFAGEKSAEDTTAALKAKLDLYLNQ